MVIRRARDLFFPNVLVCVELRGGARFIFRALNAERLTEWDSLLTFSWCAAPPLSTWRRSWCPVCAARRSACSRSTHSVALSLFFFSWVFCYVTLASPTHRETRPDERGAALGGCRPTLLPASGRCAQPASLPQGYSRHHASAAARSLSLTHSVPYDSERRTAKRHQETTGLPILATDDTEINFF